MIQRLEALLIAYRAGETFTDSIIADDEEGEYLFIPIELPDGVCAEIDDSTYGTLTGFRIYKEEA